jgi:uncharacterized protein
MEIIKNISIQGQHSRPILLDIFYNKNEKPKPIVIFSHGFKGFKDWGTFNLIAQEFARKNFLFIKFNYSHNGTTPETPNEFANLEAFSNNNFSIELDDLGTIIDFALENAFVLPVEIDQNYLFLVGHSRGGSLSILKAGEDSRVKKVASWSAPNDFSKRWTTKKLKEWQEKGVIYEENKRTGQQMPLKYQLYEDFISNKDRFDIMEVSKRLQIPVFLTHGTEDEAVEYEQSVELKKLNKNFKLSLIPNANHTYGSSHPFSGNLLPYDMQLVVNETISFLKS